LETEQGDKEKIIIMVPDKHGGVSMYGIDKNGEMESSFVWWFSLIFNCNACLK
jgi:hypothetical protein